MLANMVTKWSMKCSSRARKNEQREREEIRERLDREASPRAAWGSYELYESLYESYKRQLCEQGRDRCLSSSRPGARWDKSEAGSKEQVPAQQVAAKQVAAQQVAAQQVAAKQVAAQQVAAQQVAAQQVAA